MFEYLILPDCRWRTEVLDVHVPAAVMLCHPPCARCRLLLAARPKIHVTKIHVADLYQPGSWNCRMQPSKAAVLLIVAGKGEVEREGTASCTCMYLVHLILPHRTDLALPGAHVWCVCSGHPCAVCTKGKVGSS